MRNALAVFICLCMSGAMLGCHSNSSNTPDQSGGISQPPAPVSSDWNLKLQSNCRDMEDGSQCPGKYGFTVTSDGKWKVGPGPMDEIRTGELTTEEQAELQSALHCALNSSHLEGELREGQDFQSKDDQLIFARGSSSDELVRSSSDQFSTRMPSLEHAHKLHRLMSTLAAKYYPQPFPDGCDDSAASVESQLDAMRACSDDNECVIYDDSLNAIIGETGQFVTLDDCSKVRPLAVGNYNLVSQNKARVLKSMAQVRNSCGDAIWRQDCRGTSGFSLNEITGACVEGVCQIRQKS